MFHYSNCCFENFFIPFQVACNWVSNRDPLGEPIPGREVDTVSAGTIKHEETSHCARDDIFRFIEDKFRYSHLTFGNYIPKRRSKPTFYYYLAMMFTIHSVVELHNCNLFISHLEGTKQTVQPKHQYNNGTFSNYNSK